MKTLFLAGAAVAALFTATAAQAELLDFDIRPIGDPQSFYTFQFTLDTDRDPSFQVPNSVSRFAPTTITYTLPGSTTPITGTESNLGPSFFPTFNQGGVSILRIPIGNGDQRQVRYFGPELFTGSTTDPQFKLGSFDLALQPKNVSTDVQTFDQRVTISLAASAVPEPSTWAMMICGFGLVGGAMRRRGRQALRTT